jgi:hypothetical protein
VKPPRNTDRIWPFEVWRCDTWDGIEFVPGSEYVARDDLGHGLLLNELGEWVDGKQLDRGTFTLSSDFRLPKND